MADPTSPRPSAPRVVVAGEALVDLTPGRADDGRAALVPVPGGAPLNLATAARRMGADVAWSGPLGSDAFGAAIRDRLDREGVGADLVVDVDVPTSLAVVHLDGEGRASYGFYLDGTSLRHRDAAVPALGDGEVLVVACGAIGLVDPPYGLALAGALRRESGRRPVWLDPNIRPSAVADRAAYLSLLDELVAGCAGVKASDEDLAWLVGGDRDDAISLARRWAAAGPGVVVLTLGPDGAVAIRPGRADVSAPAPAVEVVDTVGAGDTVTGALLAELQRRAVLDRDAVAGMADDDLQAVLRTAVTAAAITCTRRGADPPTRAEVRALDPAGRRAG